jgi:hypothetical protein
MILILVQSCDDAPYGEMMKAQMNTWDKIEHPETKTLYYLSEENAYDDYNCYIGNKIYMLGSEAYDMMHWRQKLAFDHIKDIGINFDYLFRTNASSYVNKKLLVEFSKSLPKEKCYCGIDGGGYASGAGVFLSPDVVEILRTQTDESPTAYEDAYMGAILGRNGITVTPGAKRCDISSAQPNIPNCYHYRCKPDNGDRTKDIEAMYAIYNQYPNN